MDGVLDIHAESDVDSNPAPDELPKLPKIDEAKNEMMNLLREIRSNQCTKNDFIEYGLAISNQFNIVDERIQ